MVVNNTNPVTLDVDFSNSPPPANSPYMTASNWKVQWRAKADDPGNDVDVDTVAIDTQHLQLTLKPTPAVTDARGLFWSVMFSANTLPYALINFAPKPLQSAGESCTDKKKAKPPLCPAGPKDTPDISLNGSFLAAGGTSPIYALNFKGGYIFPRAISRWELYPAVSSQVQINQDVKPPNTRTRFDPDSITFGFGFTKFSEKQGPFLQGMRYQFQLPTAEFSRSDPSFNLTGAALAVFDLKPWQPSARWFGTFYPFIGLEGGHNLSHPNSVDKVPVDFSTFNGILRGYTGADTVLAFVDENDPTTNVFSIGATYRLRLPALDEPFVETLHQVTTVDLTTKARHWVETDINYTLPKWKYLSLAVTYQYGELPPLFNFVDHKVTVGLNFQAIQTRKALGTKLVQ